MVPAMLGRSVEESKRNASWQSMLRNNQLDLALGKGKLGLCDDRIEGTTVIGPSR